MKNELTVEQIVKEANKQLLLDQDKGFIRITGCDTECTIILLSNTRNNIEGEEGRNRLSLKDYCKEHNYNHRCIYSILRDGTDEYEGLKWITKEEGSTLFKITAKGMIEMYKDCENITSPIMTVIDGSLYVDETHEYFNILVDNIEGHPLFDQCGGYNDKLKEAKLVFSRNETSLAEELGIPITLIEIEYDIET